MNPIKLTLTAELNDGRIVDIIIPFSLPEGMTLSENQSGASPGSTSTKRTAAPQERELSRDLDRAQREVVSP